MWHSWGWSTSAVTSMGPAGERQSPGHGQGASAVTGLAADARGCPPGSARLRQPGPVRRLVISRPASSER